MTDIPQYQLRQGGRVCIFDGLPGVKKGCEEYGFEVEVLKDRRIKIKVDGFDPKIYSPPGCDGYLDEDYCGYIVNARAVERDMNPWYCKLQLKRVCEGRGEENVVYVMTESEARELGLIDDEGESTDPSKNIVFIDDKEEEKPGVVRVEVHVVPPEERVVPPAEPKNVRIKKGERLQKPDLDLAHVHPAARERLGVVSNEPAKYRPDKPDEAILEKYPKTKAYIDGLPSEDKFVRGALTIEAINLAKKNKSDFYILSQLKKKYAEMKKKFD
jgi:hypothetical protein